MYYEEQWIEGALCWRTSPYGAWTRYTANELAHRYESAEKRAAAAQATVEALQREWDRLREALEEIACDIAGSPKRKLMIADDNFWATPGEHTLRQWIARAALTLAGQRWTRSLTKSVVKDSLTTELIPLTPNEATE